MSFHVVIPARYASTRLEGKPLLEFAGKPMIQHVYEAAQKSQAEQIIVATDDQRIADAVKGFGCEVCLTRSDHESGTDRLQEVAAHMGWADHQVIVNVQGDEPLIPSAVIDQVAANLQECEAASAATLSWPITTTEQMFDPNSVKVVADEQGLALYFSRAPIPWHRDSFQSQSQAQLELQPNQQTTESNLDVTVANPMRHIGIYAYRVGLLHQFVEWPMATLEHIEKLEQLRILANGQRMHVAKACEQVPAGVDTAEDARRVADLLAL